MALPTATNQRRPLLTFEQSGFDSVSQRKRFRLTEIRIERKTQYHPRTIDFPFEIHALSLLCPINTHSTSFSHIHSLGNKASVPQQQGAGQASVCTIKLKFGGIGQNPEAHVLSAPHTLGNTTVSSRQLACLRGCLFPTVGLIAHPFFSTRASRQRNHERQK